MQEKEYDPVDTDCVVSAANYLEVSEFVIFRNAYAAWYGRAASDRQLEKIFALYLLRNKVPLWVRNYARKQVPQGTDNIRKTGEFSQTANILLYFAAIAIEYVLLASYLVMR